MIVALRYICTSLTVYILFFFINKERKKLNDKKGAKMKKQSQRKSGNNSTTLSSGLSVSFLSRGSLLLLVRMYSTNSVDWTLNLSFRSMLSGFKVLVRVSVNQPIDQEKYLIKDSYLFSDRSCLLFFFVIIIRRPCYPKLVLPGS